MSDFERTPPHDLAAEQCALGGMMLSRDAICDVLEVARADDFYRPAHQLVFAAVDALYGRGEPADPVAVAAELTRRGDIGNAGGAPYLHTLIASVPTAANAGYYARIVAEKAILRRAIEVGTRIVQAGYEPGTEAERIFDTARTWLDDAAGTERESAGAGIGDLMREVLEQIEDPSSEPPGLTTGIADLDAALNRLRPAQLVIIAGRPGSGKSALALNAATHAAFDLKMPVHFWSLEMSRQELTLRAIAAEARVSFGKLMRRQVDEGSWQRIAAAYDRISAAPLQIWDPHTAGMADIRGELRAAQRRRETAALLVVDYLQLMQNPRRTESRQQEVSELARGLKQAGKEFAIPVIALSQLNRGSEHRPDKRPVVSDLRESGELEQAADVVLLLHRDEMYDSASPRAGEADIIIGKQRNGPQCTVTTTWQGEYQRFMDMAPASWSPSDVLRSA